VAPGSYLSGGHTPAHTWRLSPASVLGTPLRTRGAWATCLGAWHTPAHTWRLGMPRLNYP